MRTGLALIAVLTASACARAAAAPPPGSPGAPDRISIEVENRAYSDATLHVYRMGRQIRLGIVTALETETFTVEWPAPLDLRIRIDLFAGPACVTRPMSVDPGEVVFVQIEDDLSFDFDCVRIRER